MFSFFKPSDKKLRRIRAEQGRLGFTYAAVGVTQHDGPLPDGYAVDHTRVELGRGADAFDKARAALARWEQFRLGWLEPFPADTPLRTGETVIVIARANGLWCTNAARVVYTIDDADDKHSRFGFAYGTLPDHVESGEERFLIEWDRVTDQVWFDILAFSRPRHLFVRLARDQARAMQKRFAHEACEAMRRFRPQSE